MPPPEHLPARLAITLWDFSWYTRTGPGQPFEDLDAAFAQARERGYNCVRICAMPFLLFGSGLDTRRLVFGPLGGEYGQRTRWYDVRGRTEVDGRSHLIDLFRAAERHGCYVIVSSWEYQQSPSLSGDRAWADALVAVSPDKRIAALADAQADLVTFLAKQGLSDRIAFVELHNEVQYGKLTDVLDPDEDPVLGLQDLLEEGIDRFRTRHPDVAVAANYAHVPVASMRGLPRNSGVAVFHPYVNGVLDELIDAFALRDVSRPFPQESVQRELLRAGAPPLEDWQPPEADRWRLEATAIPRREIYVHDWCDPQKWDAWLYERAGRHLVAMRLRLDVWIDVAADWAADQGVPLVFGEGWVGYTPLCGTFEEGPIGAALCEYAVERSLRVGAWGTLVCSNAAPHHPMWADVPLQRRLNDAFTSVPAGGPQPGR